MTHGGKQKLLLLALIATAFLSWEVGKLAAQTWQKVVPSGGGGTAGPTGPQGLTGPQGPVGPAGSSGSSSSWQCTGAVSSYAYVVCIKPSTGQWCYTFNFGNPPAWSCYNSTGWPG